MRRDEHIIVFGDFDLDGISATTVLTRGLRAFGAKATPFIPRRFEEGYGITEASIARLRTLDPGFVVTVDCGIACKAEAAALVEAGIGVAITDHHEPADLVPEDVPVADPKCGSGCAERHPGRRGRCPQTCAGARGPVRTTACMARLHRLRHPWHGGRPDAYAR